MGFREIFNITDTPLEMWLPGQLYLEGNQGIIDALWDAGICMDDWDYLVVGPPDILDSQEEPLNYWHEQILRGCSSNRWYLVRLNGTQVAVGVAYHA